MTLGPMRSTRGRAGLFSVVFLASVFLASAFLALLAPSTAQARITKGPWVQRVTSTSALVRVEVDPPGPVSVELSAPRSSGGTPIVSEQAKALHSIPVTGLEPGTRYRYTVQAGETTKGASFVSAPREDSNAAFTFHVYGDNRSDDASHAAVVRAMVPQAADFALHTGDFVEDGASRADWQSFFDVEAPLLGSRCVYSAVGNHELTDGAGVEYVRFFGPTDVPPGGTRPEHLDGTARWGNTRFFFLNGTLRVAGAVDRAWLDKALTESDGEKGVTWRVVVVHHGPWSSGPHGNNTLLHERGFVDLFRAHKVDLVLAGHDHIYERGWADGLAYVVSGGGGAPTYKIKSRLPETRTVESTRHFVSMAVSPSAMQLTALRSDGTSIERCGLLKGVGWDCDAKSSPAPPPPPAASRCACDAIGARTAGGPSVAAGLCAGVIAIARRRRRAWQGGEAGRYSGP